MVQPNKKFSDTDSPRSSQPTEQRYFPSMMTKRRLSLACNIAAVFRPDKSSEPMQPCICTPYSETTQTHVTRLDTPPIVSGGAGGHAIAESGGDVILCMDREQRFSWGEMQEIDTGACISISPSPTSIRFPEILQTLAAKHGTLTWYQKYVTDSGQLPISTRGRRVRLRHFWIPAGCARAAMISPAYE